MLKKLETFNNNTKIFLKEKQEFIIEEFLEKNLIAQSIISEDISEIKYFYQNILRCLCKGDLEKFLSTYIKLTELYIKLEIPYIALLNELSHMQNIIMELLINYDKKDEIITVFKIHEATQNEIAKEYLKVYSLNLISICNNRLSSLSDMVEQFVVDHYADHLKWLIKLTISIKEANTDTFPQTDKTICKFGKWISNDAKKIIQNNSKLKELDRVHSQLHYISSQIKQILSNNDSNVDYDILLTYLEKCELLSLSIGTELALIDNTIVNQKATKDTLTGALGRQVLSQIFQNQYEISLATTSKFVLAMCDLDFFKKINDNYGHIAGDKMLQSFTQIVKNNLRNSDLIIRYGGEEFILILPAIDENHAFSVLDKIRIEFENFILVFEENNIRTTVSMGMIEIEAKDRYNKDLLEEYINYADIKLYKAKQNGRNSIKK